MINIFPCCELVSLSISLLAVLIMGSVLKASHYLESYLKKQYLKSLSKPE